MVDTTGKWLSVSISQGLQVLSHICVLAQNKISEKIMDIIDFALLNSSLNKKQIDEFYAVTGPGSFTGLRIGVSVCLGLSVALNKPAYGISTNDAFAISLDRPVLKTAVKIRGKEYAYKKYDFENMIFSNFEEISEDNLTKDIVVIDKIDTSKCIISKYLDVFRTGAEPFYFKKQKQRSSLIRKAELTDINEVVEIEKDVYDTPWSY